MIREQLNYQLIVIICNSFVDIEMFYPSYEYWTARRSIAKFKSY